MAKIFGANWTTTVSGYLTVIFGAIYTEPGLIHWIPEPAQGILWNISKYLVAIGFITFAHQVKDRTVTGGSVAQDLKGSVAPPDAQSRSALVTATKLATR